MNAYFFNTTPEERNNILDQHKKVYDGFVTSYGQQINQQPLYVQDYANDKGGMVVNNRGDVKTYTNININESNAFTGAKYLPDENIKTYSGGYDPYESEYEDGFDGKDKIADSKTDLEHGTFGEDESEFDEVNLFDLEGDLEEDDIVMVQEQVNKTLNMFKRFKKY